MQNISTEVHQTSQALSSTDYKQELEAQKQPYNPIAITADFFRQMELDRKRKQYKEREAQIAAEKEQRRKLEQDYYKNKRIEAHYLEIACAILSEDIGEDLENIELIPNFNQAQFIETITYHLGYSDFQLLTEKVNELSEKVNDKLSKIKSWLNPKLSFKYHQPNPKHGYFCNAYGGLEETESADVLPTMQLLTMESEGQLLSDLACELNAIIENRQEEDARKITQTLEA